MQPGIARAVEERSEIRMGQGRAQDVAHIEMGVVGAVSARGLLEADDDVGERSLGVDEGLARGCPSLELRHHFIQRIAAPGGVAMDLPLDPELLFGIEIDLHVVAVTHRARRIAEQAFGDDELLGLDVFRRFKRAVAMVVDGLQDGLAAPEQTQMLLENVDMVGARVERRQAGGSTLRTAVAVIVVSTDHRAVLGTQNLGDAGRERRLARRRIADDAEDDRMINPFRHRLLQTPFPPRRLYATSRAATAASRSFGMKLVMI